MFEQNEINNIPARVVEDDNIMGIDFSQNYSSLLKNVRFNNKSNKYNLYSKSNDNQLYLIAQCIFNPIHTANHIFHEDGKKKTLDSLL